MNLQRRLGGWIASSCVAATVALAANGAAAATAQPTLKDVLKPSSPASRDTGAATNSTDGAQDDNTTPAGKDSPRAAFENFRAAVDAGNFEQAGRYLNLTAVARRRPQEAAVMARELAMVLDRSLWVDPADLSDDPRGDLQDGLPAGRDRVGSIETTHGSVDVLLERVRRDNVSHWVFSAATVAQVPALYRETGSTYLTNLLPPFFFEVQILDLQLWQWLAVLLLAVAAYPAALLGTALLMRVVRPLARRTRWHADEDLPARAVGPLRLIIAVLFFSAGVVPIGLPVVAHSVVTALAKALLIVAFTWSALRILDVLAEWAFQTLAQRGQMNARALVPPGRKMAKVLIVGLALVAILDNLGFNVTAVIAGLGIGGIAVALAAQKSVENLFGGISLYADQPVRVGDVCRFGDKLGTIEEIGLRSTRVRSLDRTLVTVPNSEFANMQLENFNARDRIWYHPTIGLRYETTPDQMRYILRAIHEMLRDHPRVDSNPPRVHFVTFNAYSLDLEISAYVKETDNDRYLEVAEDLNLRIMDIVAEAGSSFAFPSQTTYHEPGTGLDLERQRAAEEAVRSRPDRQTHH